MSSIILTILLTIWASALQQIMLQADGSSGTHHDTDRM
jgi:hypothetical protein